MSDNPAADREIDAVLFGQYLKGKSLTLTCPVCNTTGFDLLTTERDRGIAMLEFSRSNPGISDTRPFWTLLLDCQNCGHILVFDRDRVVKWLNANG